MIGRVPLSNGHYFALFSFIFAFPPPLVFVIQRGEECKPCGAPDLSGRRSDGLPTKPIFLRTPRNPHFAIVAFHFA